MLSSWRQPRRQAWVELGLIAVVGFLTLFLPWQERPVSGILEERVAITAREMWRTDEWVLPTMNGVPRLQKPPLAYWLPRVCAMVRGEFDDKVLRLPFAILGVLCALAVWRMGRLAAGPGAGLFAALAFLTSALVVKECRLATADSALLFATVVASWAYYEARVKASSGAAPGWAAATFWGALGLGILAKGPIVLLTALAPILVEAAATRSRVPLRALASRAGPLVFLAVAIPWPVAVVMERWHVEGVPPLDTLRLWYLESLGKVLPSDGVAEGYRYLRHSKPWHYYFSRFLAVPGLWSPVVLAGLWFGFRRGGLARAAWFHLVVLFAAFSLCSEKKLAYLLPVTWACAVLAGQVLADHSVSLGPWLRQLRWPAVGLALLCAAAFAAELVSPGMAAAVAERLNGSEARAAVEAFLSRPWVLGAALALTAIAIVSWTWLSGSPSPRLAFSALVLPLAAATPLYNDLKSGLPPEEGDIRRAARQASALIGSEASVFCVGTDSMGPVGSVAGGMVYYLDRRVELVSVQRLGELSRVPHGGSVLVALTRLAELGGLPPGSDGNRDYRLAGPFSSFLFTCVLNPDAPLWRDRVALIRRRD